MSPALIDHPKRPWCTSCGIRLHRHGHRRWRCSCCGRTRRYRWKKRGRKFEPGAPADVTEFYLRGKISLRDIAEMKQMSYGTAHERIRRGTQELLKGSTPQLFQWNGSPVLLILDAL